MARQPIFGADDLRHPNHVGPNPFADEALPAGQAVPDSLGSPMGSTINVSDYEPTGGYTAALAGRGRRLMIMASTGTLLGLVCVVGSFLFAPFGLFSAMLFNFYRVLFTMVMFLTLALTLPATMMSTFDLRAMRAGAMDPADQGLTIWARRVAAVGLALSAVAGAWIVRIIAGILFSL